MFKNIALISGFLITLGVTQLSEGAQPACGACAAAAWTQAVDKATAAALEKSKAVYTTPIHVTLRQEGNKYTYFSSYDKSTIMFAGKRGEEIAIGGKAARVDNAKALKGIKSIHTAPQHKEGDEVWDVVVIEYNN